MSNKKESVKKFRTGLEKQNVDEELEEEKPIRIRKKAKHVIENELAAIERRTQKYSKTKQFEPIKENVIKRQKEETEEEEYLSKRK
jgi:hypothetical protein